MVVVRKQERESRSQPSSQGVCRIKDGKLFPIVAEKLLRAINRVLLQNVVVRQPEVNSVIQKSYRENVAIAPSSLLSFPFVPLQSYHARPSLWVVGGRRSGGWRTVAEFVVEYKMGRN